MPGTQLHPTDHPTHPQRTPEDAPPSPCVIPLQQNVRCFRVSGSQIHLVPQPWNCGKWVNITCPRMLYCYSTTSTMYKSGVALRSPPVPAVVKIKLNATMQSTVLTSHTCNLKTEAVTPATSCWAQTQITLRKKRTGITEPMDNGHINSRCCFKTINQCDVQAKVVYNCPFPVCSSTWFGFLL